ncbi:MAG: hypothetical protein GXP62_22095 [Oligoflexia bacterium]|nr:hypothetical protein [Oligoflexia bacterium]
MSPVNVEVLDTQLKQELAGARSQLLAGQRQAAADAISASYQGTFKQLAPVLRAHDAQATLELEYAFGQVAVGVARRGSSDAVTQLDSLVLQVDAAVTALPPPPGTLTQDPGLGPTQKAGGIVVVPQQVVPQ